MEPKEPRACDHCRAAFAPYRQWQRFCSAACKDRYHAAERDAILKAIRRKKRATTKARKRSATRAPRCQINAEATELARAAMELYGFASPSEAVIAALRGELPPTPPPSRVTAACAAAHV